MAYAKIYKGAVSNEICDKTVSEMNTLDFQEHTFYNANTNEYKPRSGSQELSMSWGNVSTKNDLNKIFLMIFSFFSYFFCSQYLLFSSYFMITDGVFIVIDI